MTNSENNHHAKEGTAELPQSHPAPPPAPEGNGPAPGGSDAAVGAQDGPAPGGPDAAVGAQDEPLISAREPQPAADGDGPQAAPPPPPPDPASLSPQELQALLDRADRADEYLGLAQRKQAEFENFRKRAARETTAAQERGATRLAKELLPAVDNLERALQHAPDDGDDHGFVAGVKHVHADLIAALQRAGIEQFSPQGEQFDPTLHEAIAQTPIEGTDPGIVVEVYQRGYRAGETVVRPARVVVAG